MNDCVGKETGIFDTKFQYTHANFWASQDKGTATLFFSEFSNDEDSNYEPICYPVSGLSTQGIIFYLRIACIYKNSYVYVISCCIFFSSEVRCCYCEYQGVRIVHPVEKCWEGASGFERIACGEHNFTNAEIVSRAKLIDNQVMGIFVKDYIYLDPTHDAKLIQAVNRAESVMNLDLDAEMRRIKSVAAAGHYPQEASFLI